MSFDVRHPNAYNGRFPNFREPSEIGCFSLDGERRYHDDNHQLKYICMPNNFDYLDMDLNEGYDVAIRKEFGKKERLDSFLTWILHHQDQVQRCFKHQSSNELNIDFVCFRGLLTAVCNTIYENKDDWLICATKYKSVIYLCAFDTEQSIQRRETATKRDKVMSFWGYKFEQYMSADSPTSSPDLSVPVNEKEEYCIVLKGRLNSHTILFSAEVDGKDPEYLNNPNAEPVSTKSYTELKTSRIITTHRQNQNFARFKLLKWWLQSFLAGIPKIICGFRDDQGVVRNLDIFPVHDIPKMAQNMWSPAATLNFSSCFLDFVKRCVKKDDPYVVYKFYWKPGSPITCEELKSPTEYQVLPEWYISNFKI
ncbi:decapping and exoribonuclease protein [Parasteatoda tepidariorum]|uniref:decapping and exoribonuclease protein n=1 Tax=Parasteatoda tepidariorum TaxID=114398 RepID=UPI001C71C099|nr:decapping and exoribonuclease protein [Parasteatoda tepidariorum]